MSAIPRIRGRAGIAEEGEHKGQWFYEKKKINEQGKEIARLRKELDKFKIAGNGAPYQG